MSAKKLDKLTNYNIIINHINDNHIKFEVSLHFGGDLAYCAAWRRRTAEFAVALAVPTEGPKFWVAQKKIHNRLFDETCFASNSAKIGGGTGDAIAPRTPGSGGPLAETCDSCTAVCTALPSAAAAVAKN